ncbi:DUF3108 [Desulfonema limicola]|uniref:DUF3108 n=1 Tax=Desulfonema limicola TaxID=45656 RepID=A0A975GE34_9BACT|nr:DUF3108 domain-containing protein [Desulfonema limicola]QTA77877.1 DUF3108 [Desulfonema limicola]
MTKLQKSSLLWVYIIMAIMIFTAVFQIYTKPVYADLNQNTDKIKPFYPGEKLTYELRWGMIPAGRATLEVLPFKIVNNIPAYHFVVTAESNDFVDIFYKVRDRIDAYADIDMTRSVLYQKKQHEGKSKRDILVNFDWENNTAIYSNFGKQLEPISLMSGTFDPLSAFYFTRFSEFEDNMLIQRPITDGKKNVIGKVKVIGKETIKSGDKEYETFLIEPELEHVKGVFEKSKNAKIQIWISADNRRIPIRIKSEVVVGSFVGELVSVTEGDPLKNKL